MNLRKSVFLILSIFLLVGILVVGCQQQPQKPTAPAPQTDQAKQPAATATYVGTQACLGCHTGYADFKKTNHFATFKPLSEYPLETPAGQITIWDMDQADTPKSTTVDLTKAYGVMVDDYIIAEVPATSGFKGKIYRVAAVNKKGDKYEIIPAKAQDFDKDGKPDFGAPSYGCGDCHSPGLGKNPQEMTIGCESCHGPGSNHVAATDKKGNMTKSTDACMKCHKDQPTKSKDGTTWLATNHYGVRNYWASAHGPSRQLNDCLACHTSHKVNTNGKSLVKDDSKAICNQCHAGKNLDPDKLMWKNPTDPTNHITKDHSFGVLMLEDLGDDPNTKETEMKSSKAVDLIKSKLPNLAK